MAALVSASSRAEPLSSVSIDDVTVTEGAQTEATFTVTLDAASGVDVTFDYATFDFTAAAGDDYADTSGQQEPAVPARAPLDGDHGPGPRGHPRRGAGDVHGRADEYLRRRPTR